MAEEQLELDLDEDVGPQSAADEATQARAEEMGWIPPARYKGDPERFVDAEEFIRRGETILPIVKQRTAKLEARLRTADEQIQHMQGLLKKNQETMEALERFHTAETARKVEQVRKELKAEIARAGREGDHEALAEATDQLTQLNAKVEESEGDEPQEPKTPTAQAPSPEFLEWQEENPWYGKDKRRTSLAIAIGQELRQSGDRSMGREFMDKVAEEVMKEMPLRRAASANPDKVSGGRPNASRGGNGQTYADLPPEAKQACDGWAKDLVGEGRRYKDLASWRAAYAKRYFE